MGHDGDGAGHRDGESHKEQSSPHHKSSLKRKNRPHGLRNRKRKSILSLQPESSMSIQTLRPDLASTLTSCTRRHKKQHDFTHRREGRKRRKAARVQCHREWTYSDHIGSNYRDKVVIVSYNILGVENATKHPELYSGVSPKYLDWQRRKKLLCKEVKSYQPSIMCFQEVDRFDDLNEVLGKDGFRGLHKARSGEAHDGCAIFWKADLFTLLHEENIEFQRFGLRNNVAQFCVLKMNQALPKADASGSPSGSASRSLLVGNIHVLYNPKRGDVKVGQMRIFLEKANELSQKWGRLPVVLSGDLNSLPQSAIYQFLASCKLHIHQHDRRHVSGQIFSSAYSEFLSRDNHFIRWTDEELMLATGSKRGTLRHQLKLCSAYAGVPGSSQVRDRHGEPLATSYHRLFSGTVDYICFA
ncbi:carbon catabolite repressor protein 4 homolog 5 isoform X2 [Andrographis paniculata]|uniref:carbon catabolite repressor protein 4 homolog 5 isoform X2 n=1 Tax=Andrographis paniculata TaxID=175694 RepID=UPI0021E99430|nr:carbon catabolite repressor protein 4 homolog 5 isoform X2 [Andrographis paniculata]